MKTFEDCMGEIMKKRKLTYAFNSAISIREIAELYADEKAKEAIKLARQSKVGKYKTMFTEQEILEKLKV